MQLLLSLESILYQFRLRRYRNEPPDYFLCAIEYLFLSHYSNNSWTDAAGMAALYGMCTDDSSGIVAVNVFKCILLQGCQFPDFEVFAFLRKVFTGPTPSKKRPGNEVVTGHEHRRIRRTNTHVFMLSSKESKHMRKGLAKRRIRQVDASFQLSTLRLRLFGHPCNASLADYFNY